MKRQLYIPKDALPELAKIFLLEQEKIAQLKNILTDPKNQTIIDIILAIMNGIEVSDDDASSIFAVYKYILFILEEKKLSFEDIVPEINYIFSKSDLKDKDAVVSNIEKHVELFTKLFLIKSTESIYAKRKFLTSELHNSVVNIRSVCDARPLFDEERDKIIEFIYPIYIEFTVTDSIGNFMTIPLSFDDDTFKNLNAEIEKINKKKKKIEATIPPLGEV